jgi:hypothetical protein
MVMTLARFGLTPEQRLVAESLVTVLGQDPRVVAACLQAPAEGKGDPHGDVAIDAVVEGSQFSGLFSARRDLLAAAGSLLWTRDLLWGDPVCIGLFPGPVQVRLRLLNSNRLPAVLRGQLLFDGPGLIRDRLQPPGQPEPAFRRAPELEAICGQFWYGCFTAARQIRLGRIWQVMTGVGELRRHLAEVYRWQVSPESAGHGLEGIEAVLTPEQWAVLQESCGPAHLQAQSRAIGALAAAFHRVAPRLAGEIGARYPLSLAEEVLRFLQRELGV